LKKKKTRILAPTKRTSGLEWKELNFGINRVMQYYVSEFKTERLFNMALQALDKIEAESVPMLYAMDPHKLMRTMEDISILNHAKIIVQAMNAHKASSRMLNLMRIDYPVMDPPEWNKWMTVKQVNGKFTTGFLPLNFWGDMKKKYEANNKDYTGVWKKK
jgi:succinate dehydrogenase/fumarate reductase flavoprotein subunit